MARRVRAAPDDRSVEVRTTSSQAVVASGAMQGPAGLPPLHLAAYRRMASDPHLFDPYPDDSWVAFAGETIVAAGPSLAEVIRDATEAGADDPLIVPVVSTPFAGV